jgi:hypothetical protein
MAGLAFAAGQTVKLDPVRAARFYKRACELTNTGADCDRAAIARCGADTMTRSRRAPALDRFCESSRPPAGKAFFPEDPNQPIYRDACYKAMQSFGCKGIAAGEKRVYCCDGVSL